MNESTIREKLDELAEARDKLDELAAEKQSAVNEILTPELRSRIANIETLFTQKAQAFSLKADSLEREIKSATLELGSSIKSSQLHAVWSKGRLSWDSKGLEGYAVAQPEVLAFRNEGKPSVSIRPVK